MYVHCTTNYLQIKETFVYSNSILKVYYIIDISRHLVFFFLYPYKLLYTYQYIIFNICSHF